MKTVLVVRSDCLHYSETFIREQLLAYRRWKPVLVGNRDAHALPLDGIAVHILKKVLPGKLGQLLWRIGWPGPGAVKRLKALNANLVHVHFGVDAVIWWKVLKQLNLPIIITLHGYDITIYETWWKSRKLQGWSRYPEKLRAMARHPRVSFIAVSEAIRQRAIEFGLPPERISVRPIGINCEKFSPAKPDITAQRKRVLFVGRMVEKKGARYLIEAAAKAKEKMPEIELVMAGAGPLLGALKAQAAALGLNAVFTGRLSSPDVKKQLDEARVFCLPSIRAENGDEEGLPMVILEAEACGVPVVTSASGGATEGILHGKTGFAFAGKDVAALAGYLVQLLSDDTLAAAMSKAASVFAVSSFLHGFLICMDSVRLIVTTPVEGKLKTYLVSDVSPSIKNRARTYFVDFVERVYKDKPEVKASWLKKLEDTEKLFSD